MSDYSTLSKEELLNIIVKQEKELKTKKYGLVWDSEREPEQVVLDCENNLPILKRIKSKEIKTNDRIIAKYLCESLFNKSLKSPQEIIKYFKQG